MTDQEKPQEDADALWVISPETTSDSRTSAAPAFDAERPHLLEESQPASADQPEPTSPSDQEEMVALTESPISADLQPETPPEEIAPAPTPSENQPSAASPTRPEPVPPTTPSQAAAASLTEPPATPSAPFRPQDSHPTAPYAMLPPLNRRELLIWVSASSLTTLLLSLAITLGVLSSLNGGLKYVSPEQHNLLVQQADSLNSQVTSLQKDVQGLRDRLDNLEKLSGRVTTLEKSTDTLRTQVDDSTQKVTEMKKKLTGIDSTLETLQNRGDSYDTFFTGLRDQINQLLNKLKLP